MSQMIRTVPVRRPRWTIPLALKSSSPAQTLNCDTILHNCQSSYIYTIQIKLILFYDVCEYNYVYTVYTLKVKRTKRGIN